MPQIIESPTNCEIHSVIIHSFNVENVKAAGIYRKISKVHIIYLYIK